MCIKNWQVQCRKIQAQKSLLGIWNIYMERDCARVAALHYLLPEEKSGEVESAASKINKNMIV